MDDEMRDAMNPDDLDGLHIEEGAAPVEPEGDSPEDETVDEHDEEEEEEDEEGI
jgi:hypothetical protein